ncbi:MAG: PTS transporter subunit EIIC [Holdemania filiformis]
MTSAVLFFMIGCSFDGGISMGFLGGRGLFFAMFVSCLSVFITHVLFEKNIKITLPDSVPPNVSAPFEQLIPLVINVIVFYLLNVLCLKATGVIIHPERLQAVIERLGYAAGNVDLCLPAQCALGDRR